MHLPRPSLRILTTLLLAALSVALLLLSGEIYRRLAYDNQRHALEAFVEYRATELLQELEEQTRDIGLAIQAETTFRDTFMRNDVDMLNFELDNQFHQYHVTSGLVKLVRLYVYDMNLSVMAHDSMPPQDTHGGGILCESLSRQARARNGTARLQIIGELCSTEGRPYYAVIVPIGGLKPIGYIQVVTDPSQILHSIADALQMPVRITLPGGRQIYTSEDWQDQGITQDRLIADYTLRTASGKEAFTISAMNDISKFNQDLAYARNLAVGVGGAATLLAVLVALFLLQKTTLEPINSLTRQLRNIRQNRKHLGEQVEVQGDIEVRELANVFNDMGGELNKLYHTLEHMAYTDSLTGLPNRVRFRGLLQQAIQTNALHQGRFGLILLDLDGFKEINDTLGHPVGDVLLQQVTERLKKNLPPLHAVCLLDHEDRVPVAHGPQIARLGGDEFGILLPALTNEQEAMTVAHEINETLQMPFVVEGNAVAIGGSMGIALFPDHGGDDETLLRRADIAMYLAKSARNVYAVYDPALDQSNIGQLMLRAELRNALDGGGGLVLHYQPKLHLKSGHVLGVEALIRWQHPQRGLLPPEQFLPLAERSNLIGALTQWVLVEALRQHTAWRQAGLNLKVAINLSPRALFDLRLPDQIEHHLKAFRLSPSALELEITEDAIMIDPLRATEILARLNAMRIRLAIDDFGTGYSSLSYLKHLPVDEIKIDKSFVMEMGQSRSDAAIVHATIDLARNLGLNVVAEGVENEEALQALIKLGCDTVQGFHISRALPGDAMQQWLCNSPFAPKERRAAQSIAMASV